MKLVLIGTGAAAAELTVFINHAQKLKKTDFKIKGYIDVQSSKNKYWKKYSLKYPFLGDYRSYKFSKKESYILTINDIKIRTDIINFLSKKNIKMANFIHPTAIVADTSKMGKGNVIYPYCLVGPQTKIGDFNFLNSNVAIGHDSKIADNNIFSPNCCIAGHSEIGKNNFFGLHSAVTPGRKVGKDIEDNQTIFHRFKEKVSIVT